MPPDSSHTDTIIAGSPLHSDALLQASRRLDWRFLLPDPELGQVAYVGPARGALVESLQLFSASLTPIDPSAAHDERYDVVVASLPSYAALRSAAGLVRPGGFLYVEAYGPLRLGHPRSAGSGSGANGPRLRYAADYAAAIERCGFGEIAAHWHWPNFESCTEIVPLDERDALLLAVSRRQGRGAARLKATIGRWLARSGLLARLAPCYSVVARKNSK